MSGTDYEDMKILAKQVAERLEEQAFCVVFAGDLERCWARKGDGVVRAREKNPNLRQFSRLDCRNSRGGIRY
jgi:hypothetical protein